MQDRREAPRRTGAPRGAAATRRQALLVVPLIAFTTLAALDLLPRDGELTVFGSAAIWRGLCATLAVAMAVQATVVLVETLLRTTIVGLEGDHLAIRRGGWRRRVPLREVRSVQRGQSTWFTDSTLQIDLETRRWTVKGLDPAAVDELLARLDPITERG